MKIKELLLENYSQGFKVQSLGQFLSQAQDDIEETYSPGLGADQRKASDQEISNYLQRVKDRSALAPSKRSRKRPDKYKYPQVHASDVHYIDADRREIDVDFIRDVLMTRPKKIIKQNKKMVHSDGTTSIFVNIGLPAIKGLVVDEHSPDKDFIIVNTCPGAGACQIYCYALKGNYIMFKNSWRTQGRVLNFLYNDPQGFADKLINELSGIQKKFPDTKITVRWHDSGDFFSPEYLSLAQDVANALPNIEFYAYTKISDVAKSSQPILMNFSKDAKRRETRNIDLKTTKHSETVPSKLFYDLIARDGRKLQKDAKGRMQFKDTEAINTFKRRLADTYDLDINSILTYDEMLAMPRQSEPQYNVIVMPGDGDESASRRDVLGTYLLFH